MKTHRTIALGMTSYGGYSLMGQHDASLYRNVYCQWWHRR